MIVLLDLCQVLLACADACVNYDTLFTLSAAPLSPITTSLDRISAAVQSLVGLGIPLLQPVPVLLDRIAASCLRVGRAPHRALPCLLLLSAAVQCYSRHVIFRFFFRSPLL